MEAVAHLAGVVRWRSPHARRSLVALTVVAGLAAIVMVYRTTVPYDPLATTGGFADVMDVPPGTTWTVVYPVTTESGERATIVSGTLVPDGQTQPIALHGLTTGLGIGAARSPAGAAHQQHASLVPIRGLRFSTAPASSASRSWLKTYAFVAVTVRVLKTGLGCVHLPSLSLRYRVGTTEFRRVVPSPIRFEAPGSRDCLSS
jgi:hypothetical protein